MEFPVVLFAVMPAPASGSMAGNYPDSSWLENIYIIKQ
jgi:hypothetical protein